VRRAGRDAIASPQDCDAGASAPGGFARVAGDKVLRVHEPVETPSGDPSLELPEFDAPPDEPLPLLESWVQSADARGVREPRALALATADAAGRPSNRIVLLKKVSPSIVFAFGADSRKGRDLAVNPRAAGTLDSNWTTPNACGGRQTR
jgi:hypothetical protein